MVNTVTNDTALRVEKVRQHVTIFDVFERMGVNVTPETQQMRCPFHNDHSPSARVYAEQNKLYCWTCQKSWDVIAAAQDHFRLAFHDALTWLEQEFGIPGGTPTLAGSIRTQLSSRVAPNVQEIADTIERLLRERRQRLGYERYTRCLLALDLTIMEAAEKRMRPDVLQQRLQALMKAAQ